jgi:anaerobic carbon-monoxide dehydrogenase iron sulfur subunit
MKRIVVRLDKCVGCRSCETACSAEHSPARSMVRSQASVGSVQPRIRVRFGPAGYQGKKGGNPYPVWCRHCDYPKCANACLSGALVKGDDGVVRHDPSKCIGCGVCITVCPFGAIARDGVGPSIVKCDLCPDRVSPACVAACRSGAMIIQWEEVDLSNEPVVEVIEG